PGADAARAVPLRVAHAARAAGGAVALRVAHAATGADAGLDQPLELVRRGRGLRLDGGGIIEKVIEHRVHGSFRLRSTCERRGGARGRRGAVHGEAKSERRAIGKPLWFRPVAPRAGGRTGWTPHPAITSM